MKSVKQLQFDEMPNYAEYKKNFDNLLVLENSKYAYTKLDWENLTEYKQYSFQNKKKE